MMYVFDPHTAPVRDWCNVNPAELVTGRAWVQRAAAKHVRPQGRGSCSAEGWGPRYEISLIGAWRETLPGCVTGLIASR